VNDVAGIAAVLAGVALHSGASRERTAGDKVPPAEFVREHKDAGHCRGSGEQHPAEPY
jgi:hypothetical protein